MGKFLKKAIHAWRKDISGATAVEYGLLVAAVAVTIIAGVMLFGQDMNAMFSGLTTLIAR